MDRSIGEFTHHTATFLGNGGVLVAGGERRNRVVSGSAVLYDPAIDNWILSTPHLIQARVGHTATLLSNGKVLVVGGSPGSSDSGTGLDSAELYTP